MTDVITDEDPSNNLVEFDFNEKAEQAYHRTFLFPHKVAMALKELKDVTRVKFGETSFLFPHFVPLKGLCRENYLFLFNVNRFLGFTFSFRTFRIHAISVVTENKLRNRPLPSIMNPVQFCNEMRRLMEDVRENFSNHTGRNTLLPYLDIRILFSYFVPLNLTLKLKTLKLYCVCFQQWNKNTRGHQNG